MASLTQRLAEAEEAQHRLLTGTAVVECRDSNGDMVRYTAANSEALAAYLAGLRRQMAGQQRRSTTSYIQTSKGI